MTCFGSSLSLLMEQHPALLAISSISLTCDFADPSQKQAGYSFPRSPLLLISSHRLLLLFKIFSLHVFHVVVRPNLGDKQADKQKQNHTSLVSPMNRLKVSYCHITGDLCWLSLQGSLYAPLQLWDSTSALLPPSPEG